jgi:hypothetical protein
MLLRDERSCQACCLDGRRSVSVAGRAEILTLRQQINVLRRTAPKKQTFSSIDRLSFVCLYRLRPSVRDSLAIVKPETVVKLASRWLPIILALEIESAGWQANSSVGDTQAYP